MQTDNFRNFPLKDSFFVFFVFCFAFCLYANTIGHQWALDDISIFRDNVHVVKGIEAYGEILTTFTTHSTINSSESYQYRPLTQLQFATEWHFFPDNTSVYHFFNVLYYAIACALLFIVLRKLFNNKSVFFSLIITLIFVVHPMHTEVVANIKSRDEIMVLVFVLLTVLSFLLYIDKQKKYLLVLAFFSFLLALFSKENAVTFLAAIPLMIYFFRKATRKDYLYLSIILIFPIIIYLIVRFTVLSDYPASTVTVMQNYLADRTLLSRWACAIMLLGKYLFLLLIPYQQVCDYSYSQLPYVGFGSWQTLLSLIIYIFLVVYAIKGIKKKEPIAFCILFYIITMSIFSNLIYLIGSSFADRFLFIPSIGYCIAIVYLLFRFGEFETVEWNKMTRKNLLSMVLFGVILLSFSIKTVIRSADWENNFTLYHADIQKSPNSAKLNCLYGESLRDKALEYQEKPFFTIEEKEQNELGFMFYTWESIHAMRRSIAIYPKSSLAYDRMGVAYYSLYPYYKKDDFLDSAEKFYLKSLQFNPSSSITNYNIGHLYYQREEYEKAKNYYLISMRNNLLESNYLELGSAYSMLGVLDSATYFFKKHLTIHPDSMLDYINSHLAIAYFRTNDFDSAISKCNDVIRANPDYLFAYQLKIYFFQQKNQMEEALKTADDIIKMASHSPVGFIEKGNLFKAINRTDSSQYYYNLANERK